MGWALLFTSILAAMIVYGSRRLDHFDAALVGYTFATLFATFGVTYRYAMWLEPAADANVLAPGLANFPEAEAPRPTRSKSVGAFCWSSRPTASSSSAAPCGAARTG